MEAYGKILLIAMPIFLLLVLFEKWYGWRKGKDTVRNMDMIASLSSGITNVTKDVVGLSFVILSYPFLVQHLAVIGLSDRACVGCSECFNSCRMNFHNVAAVEDIP